MYHLILLVNSACEQSEHLRNSAQEKIMKKTCRLIYTKKCKICVFLAVLALTAAPWNILQFIQFNSITDHRKGCFFPNRNKHIQLIHTKWFQTEIVLCPVKNLIIRIRNNLFHSFKVMIVLFSCIILKITSAQHISR